MQFVFWVIVPYMIANRARVSTLLGVILFLFCLQYVPKILHMVLLIRRMQHVTGYIFGTAWWGFALNLIAYFIAAHVRLVNYATDMILLKVNSISIESGIATHLWG